MIYLLVAFIFMSAVFPFWNVGYWFVRGFDFPRFQIFIINLFVSIYFGFLVAYDPTNLIQGAIFLGLLLCLGIDAFCIFPYTVLSKKESKDYENEDHVGHISFLTSNILITNHKFNKILDLIKIKNPDVVLLLETDQIWDKNTKSLAKDYPHFVTLPQENGYGMLLYSKYPLVDTTVQNLVDKDVPSIFTKLKFNESTLIHLYCLHPRPPRPSDGDSDQRDGELMMASEFIKANSTKPAIVTGDLNDVAWSHTTRLFKRASHMLDPRIGRGMLNTFHVNYFFLRFPLDHFFHSKKMILAEMKRLPSVASDHYPLWTKFYILCPDEVVEQKPENLQIGDKAEIEELKQRGEEWTGPNYVKPE